MGSGCVVGEADGKGLKNTPPPHTNSKAAQKRELAGGEGREEMLPSGLTSDSGEMD